MGHAEILRLIHHGKIKGRVLAFGNRCGQLREHTRTGDDLPRQEAGSDLLEDRPENRPLRFRQPRLSTEPYHVPIRLPRVQLPRINDLLPLRQKKCRAELVVPHVVCGGTQQVLHDLTRGKTWLSNVDLVEALSNGIDRMNV